MSPIVGVPVHIGGSDNPDGSTEIANQGAFCESQVLDQQIDVATTLKVAKQILLIAQDDILRQLAKTSRECGVRNRIVRH